MLLLLLLLLLLCTDVLYTSYYYFILNLILQRRGRDGRGARRARGRGRDVRKHSIKFPGGRRKRSGARRNITKKGQKKIGIEARVPSARSSSARPIVVVGRRGGGDPSCRPIYNNYCLRYFGPFVPARSRGTPPAQILVAAAAFRSYGSVFHQTQVSTRASPCNGSGGGGCLLSSLSGVYAHVARARSVLSFRENRPNGTKNRTLHAGPWAGAVKKSRGPEPERTGMPTRGFRRKKPMPVTVRDRTKNAML